MQLPRARTLFHGKFAIKMHDCTCLCLHFNPLLFYIQHNARSSKQKAATRGVGIEKQEEEEEKNNSIT